MTMPVFDFSGKNVFVFGGTSGINLGIAHAFARCGAQLAVASRKPEKVEAARSALSHTHEALGYVLDVRDFDAVKAAVDDHVTKRGKIDVLISGAAGNFPAAAAALSPNGFKSVVDIDCIGTFHVMRAAHEALAKPGASVINISAPQAFIPMAFQAHVCAAKAGVDMLTRTLAMEWGAEGVRVNSVSPGPIDGTEGMERLAPTPEDKARSARAVPLGRLGTVDDVADVCLFLASDAARYVSGVVLPADGGWTVGRGFGGLG
ncbi:SDR family oxidoreductase [Sphingomonas sp. C3-2]|uniref:SDR family oxidoreductase n=1 Tax=Sphingomonas sp. C3-2 TaxID=3062169 RepID=UPI00294B56DF|nr:SDR family oxidoreductase [Sphingomonas sp. C3-2]